MKPLDLPDIEISLPGDAPEVEAILVMMERGRVFRFAPVSVSTDETDCAKITLRLVGTSAS